MNPSQRDRLGLLALIAAPLLMPFAIGRIQPLPGLFGPPSSPAEVVAVRQDGGLRIDALARADASPVHGGAAFGQLEGGRFERDVRQALSARGHLVSPLPAAGHFWAVMQGRGGEFYLQAPALLVQGDEWVATNLRVGEQVSQILFVQADATVHAQFADRAAREDWSPLAVLPAGVAVVAAVVLK